MLLGVSGQTLVGFSHRLEFYRNDEQSRMFDKYGERICQEGEVQTEESSKEEEAELGVEKLPEDDSDDEDILAGKQQRTVKQREGEQTPETMREEEIETVEVKVVMVGTMSKRGKRKNT